MTRSRMGDGGWWEPCSKYCQGLCPCPDPPWLWKCNHIPKFKVVDPQMRWRKPLRGFTGYTSTKYVCGYAYVGDYD